MIRSVKTTVRALVFCVCGATLVAGTPAAIGSTRAALIGMSTERVSLAAAGAEGNGRSGAQDVSADGRYVLFSSEATNLVAGDTNGWSDLFIRDRVSGNTQRASVASGGAQIEDGTGVYGGRISDDGRFVLFSSDADDVAPADTDSSEDIFLHDRQTGSTELISVATDGSSADRPTEGMNMSGNARFVVFETTAENIVDGDTNGVQDIFLRDRQAGTTVRASLSATGAELTAASGQMASVSDDGRYVAFSTEDSMAVAGDTNGISDVFRRDLLTETNVRVSLTTTGAEALDPFGSSGGPEISADGRYVAFNSYCALSPADTNGQIDVYLRDVAGGSTEYISAALAGAGTNESNDARISADGRYVVFGSNSTNLVAGDTNGTDDAFLRDRGTGALERVSVTASGAQTGGGNWPVISANGRFVVYSSDATDAVPGDSNGVQDAFLRDRGYEPPPPPPPTPPPAIDPPAPVVTPVLPRATLLTRPYSATYTRYRYRGFSVFGYLKPRHTSGISSVALQAYHYENGRWVRRATFSTKNANYSNYTKYYRTLALNRRGRWRIRAYHACSRHSATYSSYSYFTVR